MPTCDHEMNPNESRENRGQPDAARKCGIDLTSPQKTQILSNKTRIAHTFDKRCFVVPNTPDMVTQLFSPAHAKNTGDLVIVLIIFLHLVLYYYTPSDIRPYAFGALFIFWRTSYNGGIGRLLQLQSKDQRLVGWANKSRVFVNPTTAESSLRHHFYRFLKSEMETSVKNGYDFEKAPVEFNTWLLFRRLADLVLMCDFTSYCLFAAACGGTPFAEQPILTWLRWMIGVILIAGNVWAKVDAHRVVKENWYWADFFFVVEQELEFGGVFKWFKDPMYTVGYIGYYGISLTAASYEVLALSVAAHAAQLTFLYWVEEPHFRKTYQSALKAE